MCECVWAGGCLWNWCKSNAEHHRAQQTAWREKTGEKGSIYLCVLLRSRPGQVWKNRLAAVRAGRGGPFLRGASAAESVTAALPLATPSAESRCARRTPGAKSARGAERAPPRPDLQGVRRVGGDTDASMLPAAPTRRRLLPHHGGCPIGTRAISAAPASAAGASGRRPALTHRRPLWRPGAAAAAKTGGGWLSGGGPASRRIQGPGPGVDVPGRLSSLQSVPFFSKLVFSCRSTV